jgi:tetratricopeptide (TPR) repeat protein
LAIVAWVAAMSALAAAPQQSSYRQILETYRKGEFSTAVSAVRNLPTAEIESQVKLLIATHRTALLRSPAPVRIEHRGWLQAALMLHTETILMSLSDRSLRLGANQSALWNGRDRLLAALETRAPQPTTAEAASDQAFLQVWYLLVIADAQGRQHLPVAQRLSADARKKLGGYPELLLAIGALNEMAWTIEQDQGVRLGVAGDLKEAETAYRGALAGNPRLEEARIRLGRVLTLRNDLDGALAIFSALQVAALEPAYQYLTRLFEGDALERRSNFPRAVESYSAAVQSLPTSQSARIALAHLRHAEGDRTDALARMTSLATETTRTDDTNDPWWWYLQGIAWRESGYLDALRTMVVSQ